MATLFDNKASTNGGPTVYYTVTATQSSRSSTSVTYDVTIKSKITVGWLGTGYSLTATLTIGGKAKEVTLKSSSDSWSASTYTKTTTVTVPVTTAAKTLATSLKVVGSSSTQAGVLKSVTGKSLSVAEYDHYTITFNANGGSGTMSSGKKYKGITYKLPANKFTRDNYSFLGWATSSSSTTVVYKDGASITTNSALNLYAVWQLDFKMPSGASFRAYRVYDDAAGYNPVVAPDGTTGYADISLIGQSDSCQIDEVSMIFSSGAQVSPITIMSRESITSDIWYGYSDTDYILQSEKQYDVYVTIKCTNTITGETIISDQIRTYISSETYALDVNSNGTVVSIGGVATDDEGYSGLELNGSDLYFFNDDEFIQNIATSLGKEFDSKSLKYLMKVIAGSIPSYNDFTIETVNSGTKNIDASNSVTFDVNIAKSGYKALSLSAYNRGVGNNYGMCFVRNMTQTDDNVSVVVRNASSSANATGVSVKVKVLYINKNIAAHTGGGGGGGTVSWNDIQYKPDTYPPSEHGHVTQDVSDFETLTNTEIEELLNRQG